MVKRIPLGAPAAKLRRLLRGAGALLIAASFASPAQSAWMSADGPSLTIRGAIEIGDAEKFHKLLVSAAPIRVVHLDGPGGSLREAIKIGQAIRKARLITMVDAGRASCDSACTMLFAAGVARHYVNAQNVQEGVGDHYGLGYHLSYARGDRVNPSMKSDEGVRLMDVYYARMGARAASMLARKASISTLWRPNGASALKLGLATSLSPAVTLPSR